MLAVVLWSTTIAFSRSLAEALGTLTTATVIFLLSGVLACLILLIQGKLIETLKLPVPYILGCGGLFVLYELSLYLAIGLSKDREQVIEVGLLNYLWPTLTVAFSVPLLNKRARLTLLPGLALGSGGTVLAILAGSSFEFSTFVLNLKTHPSPYLLGLGAGLLWALYSNLSRRWGVEKAGAVPLFFLATGIALLAVRAFFGEQNHYSIRPALELLYMIIFPTILAYAFWDRAMRRGNLVLVASASYLTPLISTIISCAYLGVEMGLGLWAAAVMLILGAVISRLSISEMSGSSAR